MNWACSVARQIFFSEVQTATVHTELAEVGVSSWNLERCHSQWGLAASCRRSSLEEQRDERVEDPWREPRRCRSERPYPERQELQRRRQHQRQSQQFQPVALLFTYTNIVIMPKRKVSLRKKKKNQRPSNCAYSKFCHCCGLRECARE